MIKNVVLLAAAISLPAFALALLAAAISLPAFAQDIPPDMSFEGEMDWIEIVNALPDLPEEKNLLKIDAKLGAEREYFVDSKSVRVDKDGVVRYTMIVNADGVRNVIYEGIRCSSKEKKVYSVGRDNGTWGKVMAQKWQRIINRGVFGYHDMLYADFFCPGKQIVASREEALDALQKGIHQRALPHR